jgi:hypothetical protein
MVPASRRGIATAARVAPILLSLTSLVVAVAGLAAACRHDGLFVLPLDDAYVHLAVAKHLAVDGVWGVTAAGFTASVSSVAWPLLVAGIFVLTGPSVGVPIVVNVLCAGATLLLADATMRRFDVGAAARAISLQAIVFCTPLPTLVASGMEHPLQIVVLLAFVLHLCRLLGSSGSGARATAIAGGLAAAATAVRYDAIVVVVVAVLALLIARRTRAALWVAACGVLPLALFGIASVAHGWPPVPNSVLVRLPLMSEPRTPIRAIVHFLGYRGLRTLFHEPALAALLFATGASSGLRRRGGWRSWDERQWLLAIFVATLALHVEYARTAWFFRYEGYLVTMGLVAIVLVARDVYASASMPRLVAAAAVVAFAPLAARGVDAIRATPAWSEDQFNTRHQAARFLGRYYDRAVVEIGDIGEVCYRTDIRLIDVNGLGSLELLPSILATPDNSPSIDDERHAAGAADLVVADLSGRPPDGWELVGCWAMPDSERCDETVYQFHARRGADASRLASALRDFDGPPRPLVAVIRHAESTAPNH